jgi:hypothetical protein
VFAYLLTRGDEAFQNYYLSASVTTIEALGGEAPARPVAVAQQGRRAVARRSRRTSRTSS